MNMILTVFTTGIENKQLNNLQAAQETIYSVTQDIQDNTVYIIDQVDNAIIPDLVQISLDIADLALGGTYNTGDITDAIDAAVIVIDTFTNVTGEQVFTLVDEKLDTIASAIGVQLGHVEDWVNDTSDQVVLLVNAHTDTKIDALDGVVDAGIITITDAITATEEVITDAITATEGVLSGEHTTLTTYVNTTGNQIVSLINAATSDYTSATNTYINETAEVILTNLTEQLAAPIIIDIDALQASLGVPSDAALPASLPYETSRNDCTWDVTAELMRCFKCNTVLTVKTCQYCEHYINEVFTFAQCLADSGVDSQAYGACAMHIGTSDPIDITTPFTPDEVAFVMNSAFTIKHKGDIVASDTCISYPWVQPCNMHTLTAFTICQMTSNYGCQIPTTCTNSLSGMGCPSCTEA